MTALLLPVSESDSSSPSGAGPNLDVVSRIVLDIPGTWTSDEELSRGLPAGYELDEKNQLHLPGGRVMRAWAPKPDAAFRQQFARGCADLPTEEERKMVERHTTTVRLESPGGSIEAALFIMEGANALLDAGGAGVHCVNSGKSVGRTLWQKNSENWNKQGLIWNFVAMRNNEHAVWSIGMHVFGARDATLPRSGKDRFDAAFLLTLLTGILNIEARFAEETRLRTEQPRREFLLRRHSSERFAPDDPRHNPDGDGQVIPVERSVDGSSD